MNGLVKRGNLLATGAMLLLAASCQLVAGVESRSADPIGPTCALPSGPGPQVRVANLVPTNDVIDVCIRSAGAASWGHALLLENSESGGTASCQAGFAYGHVSEAFTAPAQSIDVKVIPYGQTCSAAGLSEQDGVNLTGPVDTLLRIGGANKKPEQIIDVPEDSQNNSPDVLVRFIHAAPGVGPLDLGFTAAQHLPTTVGNLYLSKPTAYGAQPTGNKAAFGKLDARGYLDELPSTLSFGAYVDGDTSKKAIFDWVLQDTVARPYKFTIYAVGAPGDNLHAVRALVCNEDPSAANPTGSDGKPRNLAQEMPGCFFSDLATISVDTFDPALYGPNSPIQDARSPLIAGAIAKRDSDVMCVVEVDDPTMAQNIMQGASAQFPLANDYAGPQLTLSTAFNNPKDQTGKPPTARTSPPCAGASLQMAAQQAISCLEQSCSTAGPGDGTGQLLPSDGSDKTGTSCISSAPCGASTFGNLLYGSPDQQYCYDCLIDYVASNQKFGDTLTACTTDPRPPLGFAGNENSFILSHYPITKQATYVLPSTNYRRTVQYAQIQLEDGPVDFYCGFFITTLIADYVPYTGFYGAGADPTDPGPNGAYAAEQQYEAKQLIDWVKMNSATSSPSGGKTPAIIAGEWRSSLGSTGDAGAGVLDLIPATMNLLNGAFTPATATGWTPQCNFCPPPANPYNSANQIFFTQQTFITNWTGDATTATTDESLIFADDVVGLPAALGGDGGTLGPVTPYYGVNVRILRPSASQ